MAKSKYCRIGNREYPQMSSSPLYQHWRRIKHDCEWENFKEFHAWAEERYIRHYRLVKKDDSKPHGPSNSMFTEWINAGKRSKSFLELAEEWNKEHPIVCFDYLLEALAIKSRNRFATIHCRSFGR